MSATRAALVFFRGVPAAMTSAHAIPSLSYLCFYNDRMQKLGLCRVGYSGRTTDKESCFSPPRWALGLLYKDVSFMFIQDQSGSFWAACDPFSKASGTCEIYSSAEATHHEGYEGPRLWDDNNPCTFLSHPFSSANQTHQNDLAADSFTLRLSKQIPAKHARQSTMRSSQFAQLFVPHGWPKFQEL